jgi:hypothetical protein
MRKGFIIVVLAITFATVGFASRNTSAGQSVADRFEKYKEVAKEKAKEKGRELFDREKQAKEGLKEVAHEVVNKAIDHYIPRGDNRPAKAVGDAAFNKDPWYKAFVRVFLTPSEIGQEPTFTDAQQTVTDKPVVPAGPFDGMQTTYVKSQPVVPANPSNENASSPKSAPQQASATPDGREGGGIVGPQHDVNTNSAPPSSAGSNNNSASASNGSSNQGNAGTGTPQAMPQPPMEKVGENHWVVVDPNKQNAPSAQQSAPAPAPAPAPSRAPDRGPGRDSMPSHEIFHDHDKPDHNTPGGRDVSGIS